MTYSRISSFLIGYYQKRNGIGVSRYKLVYVSQACSLFSSRWSSAKLARSPWNEPRYIRRVWCVYEFSVAMKEPCLFLFLVCVCVCLSVWGRGRGGCVGSCGVDFPVLRSFPRDLRLPRIHCWLSTGIGNSTLAAVRTDKLECFRIIILSRDVIILFRFKVLLHICCITTLTSGEFAPFCASGI